jgi:hypothetical protein
VSSILVDAGFRAGRPAQLDAAVSPVKAKFRPKPLEDLDSSHGSPSRSIHSSGHAAPGVLHLRGGIDGTWAWDVGGALELRGRGVAVVH